ncbi:MAG: deoxyribose-phosphate aldolase [Acetanaerobacterium sp.]
MNISKSELAHLFDHTLLKPYASEADFKVLCEDSMKNGFMMVAINSSATALCKGFLKGSPVHVGAAISFPLGQTEIETKVFEAKLAIEQGADEIDYVINIAELKNKHYDYITREMDAIVSVCGRIGILSKVIFENCYLTKDEIVKLCEISLAVGPDFIKTSTGFGTGGATVEDVRLMKSTVGDRIKVKAAGGVRTLESCLAMVEAGAERIGTSASLSILREYDEAAKA